MRIERWREATEDGEPKPKFGLTFEGIDELNGLATSVAHRLNTIREQRERRFPNNLPFSEATIVQGILKALPTAYNRERRSLGNLDDLVVRASYSHDYGKDGEPRLRLFDTESQQALAALRQYAEMDVPEGAHFVVVHEHQLINAMVRQADQALNQPVS